MNIVKSKEYMRVGAMEYGKGGQMPEQLLEYFKKKNKEYGMGGAMEYEGGGAMEYNQGDPPPGGAYFISGYENRPDDQGMIAGRERMYVAVPGAEGSDPRVLDMQSAMKEFGYENPMEMARALGIKSSGGDGAYAFEGAQDPEYRRRMIAALGGESLEGIQDRLGIGRVDYDRQRDLPNILRSSQGGM